MLDTKYSSSGSGVSSPAFVSEATITEVEDISGTDAGFLKIACDIGVKLTLDIGKEWKPTMVISGKFGEKDGAPSWGGAYVVRDLLNKIGGFKDNLEDGNKIPKTALDALVGKKFLRVSYISGTKPDGRKKYSDWNEVGTVEEGKDKLLERFKASVAKGYPKNYKPDLIEDPTSFPPVTLFQR